MRRGRRPSQFQHLRAAYRSGLEATLAAALVVAGVTVQFETHRIPYTQPSKSRTYTPDLILPNGIVIESKGLFTQEDRAKMQWVIAQHPSLDIRMVFSNPRAKLRKGSPTTYAMWCEKEGIPYSPLPKAIPAEWLVEPVERERLAAIEAFRK